MKLVLGLIILGFFIYLLEPLQWIEEFGTIGGILFLGICLYAFISQK